MPPKKNFNTKEKASVTKDIRQGMKLPVATYKKIKDELLDKYDIKGFQTLYDYLIISGIVYLKKDIVELVRIRVPEYTARYKQAKLARLGKAAKPELGDIQHVVCMMYDRDVDSFNKFCIEENIKKFWIIDILMDEFSKENPLLIEHIKTCQKLNITERKKQVSRLLNDEYIVVLPERDANEILEMLTNKYDNMEYGGLLQQEIHDALKLAENKQTEEEEVEDVFASKLHRLRQARARAVQAITEPVIDDDT